MDFGGIAEKAHPSRGTVTVQRRLQIEGMNVSFHVLRLKELMFRSAFPLVILLLAQISSNVNTTYVLMYI